MELTLEEKKARVKDLRPIDDVFFEVLAAKKEVCEEMLRTILEDEALVVQDVIVQSSERNLYGRSVRLDALCTLGSGELVNIEVQRSDDDDHLKRVRFNASSITVRESQTGDKFSSVVELYVIYISEFDFLHEGKTIYHVDKVLRETGTVVDDGLHEIFVNTVNVDGSPISDLMSCFTKKEVQNPHFPKMSAEVNRLKTTQGGLTAVCKVMQQYENVAREEGLAEGIAKGMEKGLAKGIAKGLEEGMEKGRLNTLLEVREKMAQSGMSPAMIDMLLPDLPEKQVSC